MGGRVFLALTFSANRMKDGREGSLTSLGDGGTATAEPWEAEIWTGSAFPFAAAEEQLGPSSLGRAKGVRGPTLRRVMIPLSPIVSRGGGCAAVVPVAPGH